MKSASILNLAALTGALALAGLGHAGTITNEMVVHLPFDTDYSNLAPSAVVAAPVGAPTIDAGHVGAGAVHVSNAGDGSFFNYVTLGVAPELNLGGTVDFTVSFWAKINAKHGDPSFLSNKDWTGGGNPGWVVFTSGGGNLGWNYTESGSARVDSGGSAINNTNWHHIGISWTRDGNALTFVDGVLVNTTFVGPATESLDTGLPTNIGQDGTGHYIDGGNAVSIDALMDDVAIWRRALTSFEIKRIYEFGTNGVNVSAVPDPAVVTLADTIPAANATDVRADTAISAIIVDGALPLNNGTVQLTLNGSPAAVGFNKVGNATTVTHQPAAPLPNGSTQNARIIFGDGVNSVTSSWSFVVVKIAQPSAITGHWDFDSGDLAATIGQALEYRGGPAGPTATGTHFGTTTSFGIPGIQGIPAKVMSIAPAFTRDTGYLMTHGARPNGDPAATKVNQWTLIMDILVAQVASPGFFSFIQIDDPNNGNDGDLFVDGNGGLGISGSYQGSLVRGEWHRVVFAVDSATVISKFIDGAKAADQTGWSGAGLNGRHALLPTTLLFADEDGESQAAYINSIQIRNYKMSDAGVAALGGPSADGIPLVSGQWDFNDGNLVATIGTDLVARPATQPFTAFETTVFDDGAGNVMRFDFPGGMDDTSALGYLLPHGILPNGGGQKVNQYSLIMDIKFPASSTGFRSLFQTETNGTSDGDLFVNGDNGIGISSQYQGDVTPDEWHRLVFTFDLTKRELGKYLDGTNVLTAPVGSAPLGTGPYQYLSAGVDGRWALDPLAMVLADEDGELGACSVNSIQTRPTILTPAQIVLLGRATSGGIPAAIPSQPVLSIKVGDFGTPSITWPATFTDYILERSTSLAPGANWSEVSGAAVGLYEEFDTPTPAFFYRLRKVQ